MKKNKWIAWLGVATMAISTMIGSAGCGNAETSDEKSDSQETEVAKTDTEGSEAEETDAESISGKVTIWDWDANRFECLMEEFNELYPNIEIEIVPVASSTEYSTKLLAAIAAGTELPDIGCIEIGDRYRLLNLGIWEDLEQEPYNFDPETVIAYTNTLCTTDDGKVVGIDNTLCPGGLAYKKDLAEKYFGTSDPDELEALLPDWETFMNVAKEIKKENPDLYFFPSADEDLFFGFTGQLATSYAAEDGSLNEDALREPAHYIYEFLKEGLCDKMQGYSTGWYDQFASDDNYIFDLCANWSPQYTIEGSDEDCEDQWGFMKAPGGGFYYGGTCLTINSASESKEAAWALIQYMLLDKEGATKYKELIGYYSPLASLYEDEGFISWTTSCFGSQDVGKKMYGEIIEEMEARQLSEYDKAVNTAKAAWITQLYADIDSLSEEESFDIFLNEINANMN